VNEPETDIGAAPEGVDALPSWREPVRGGHPDASLAARTGMDQLRALLTGQTPQPPLSRLTGMRLVELDHHAATFTLPLSGWLRGDDGTVPLGVLTIPADAAMACAILTGLPEATGLTTTELALRQVRPARPGGSVQARARVLESGPAVALAEVVLTDDDGAVIAYGSSLCMTLPALSGSPAPSAAPAPPVAPAPPPESEAQAAPERGPGETGPDPWERAAPDPDPPSTPLGMLTGLRPVTPADGDATWALPATGWLCAPPPGRVQGGAVATLAGAAIAAAIRTGAAAGLEFVPVELKLNYLRPLASDGREARAHARLIHRGRRVAVAGADVFDAGGRHIAVASGSAVARPARALSDG
jgi:uncharacterized protein (TIGR00369 family)